MDSTSQMKDGISAFIDKASKKPYINVLVEAIVVGICLVIFIEIASKIFGVFGMSTRNIIFTSGVLFHLFFEYTGINMWYSKKYCELIV